jgi:hypothetical protein
LRLEFDGVRELVRAQPRCSCAHLAIRRSRSSGRVVIIFGEPICQASWSVASPKACSGRTSTFRGRSRRGLPVAGVEL